MRFAYSAFEAAVRAHLGSEVADALRACLDALRAGQDGTDPDTLDDNEAGKVLAATVLGGDPETALAQASGAVLESALLVGNGTITLAAEDVGAHPLLRDWAELFFSDALMEPVMAGLAMTNLVPGAPIFDSVLLVQSDGRFTFGCLNLSWPDRATAAVNYGEPATPRPYQIVRKLDGNALFAVGVAIREGVAATSDLIGTAVALATENRSPIGFHLPGTVH